MKFVCLVLLMSLPAFAGIQSVGKGGGYGEMRAISIHGRMATLLAPCLRGACAPADIQILKRALGKPFDLIIDHECVTQNVTSCDLYDGDRVRSIAEIAARVLDARLASAGEKQIGRRIFTSLEEDERAINIDLLEGSFTLHSLNYRFAGAQRSLISLEAKDSTTDLTADLEAAIKCPIAKLEVTPLSSSTLGSAEADTASKATWACRDGKAGEATLRIYFEAKDHKVKAVALRLGR